MTHETPPPTTAAFGAAPDLQPFATAPDFPPPGMLHDNLDRLDAIATGIIEARQAEADGVKPSSLAMSLFNRLHPNERIYVALAASDDDLLHFLRLSIAEAIDKLGWVDASAMVARWSKRRG